MKDIQEEIIEIKENWKHHDDLVIISEKGKKRIFLGKVGYTEITDTDNIKEVGSDLMTEIWRLRKQLEIKELKKKNNEMW